MYCIECGEQIPANSKFCPHCGKKQDKVETKSQESSTEKVTNENLNPGDPNQETKTSIDFGFLRKSMGWYLAWVVLHLGLLLIFAEDMFGGDDYPSKYFWPFGNEKIKCYDIREFLVYTIFPLAILIIFSMIQSEPTKTEDETKSE